MCVENRRQRSSHRLGSWASKDQVLVAYVALRSSTSKVTASGCVNFRRVGAASRGRGRFQLALEEQVTNQRGIVYLRGSGVSRRENDPQDVDVRSGRLRVGHQAEARRHRQCDECREQETPRTGALKTKRRSKTDRDYEPYLGVWP